MVAQIDFKKFTHFLENFLLEKDISAFWAANINIVVNFVLLGIVIFLFDKLLKYIIVETFKAFSNKTKTAFDDMLVESNFPRYIAHIIPLYLVIHITPILLETHPLIWGIANVLIQTYTILLVVKIVRSILRTLKRFLSTKEQFKDKPLESYLQVFMLFVWGFAFIYGVYIFTGKEVISIASMGALSAVIMLIFKDTILGVVASIQVSINDIVRIGDWITFSKYGADGFVIDISLATVRVQNWDKTFTTIPTYSLISDSFQNWRGMQESGGRRIKRAIYVKQTSIKFLTPEMVEEFKKIELVRPYIEHRQREILKHNERTGADKSVLINGRNQTNFGVFRKFIDVSLNENTAINKDLVLMVRHLAPTSKGIPLEIYCFSKDKRWVNYEAIMADVFDHIIAAAPYFEIELFEEPSGADIAKLAEAKLLN
ncbi:MAG TPA: mechanosensitive ion channel domain-containing protein [Flavobacteriaceae bacterium]|nr:mechanosensitive ion channel domain-containing protein [Flavobacteriaceae bacterium]